MLKLAPLSHPHPALNEALSAPVTLPGKPLPVPSVALAASSVVRADINRAIASYKHMPDSVAAAIADRLPATARSHGRASGEESYHPRDPKLNLLPLFYSSFETEIASREAMNAMPLDEKNHQAIRMIGKRFIDVESGASIFTDPAIGKKNPVIQVQNKRVREIRAQASTAAFNRYNGTYLEKLFQLISSQLDAEPPTAAKSVVHVVRPGRGKYADDCTVNFLSVAAQAEMTDALNAISQRDAKGKGRIAALEFSDVKKCIVVSRTERSNASPIGRLVQQAYFDTSEIAPGDKVIIADDHTQAGGTILAMASALQACGAQVLAAATPTVHPFCATLALSANVRSLLHASLQEWDPEGAVGRQLARFGMPLDTLTNHEAMILIAYATDPGNPAAVARFTALENELHAGQKVVEGESDSLAPILNQRPCDPSAIVDELLHESRTSRRLVQPTPIKEVHVLDWDDCLRDEKGMNYQLMHNALAIAAWEWRDTQPLINEIFEAVTRAKNTEDNAALPTLCMTGEQFARYAITHPEFIKKHMVSNLLDELAALDPALAKKLDRAALGSDAGLKTKISHILNTEFARQYQKLIRPDADSAQRPTRAANVTSEPVLPYPDVALTLMPGAREFLDRHRNASERLLLISNRGDSDLHKEINKLQLAHYFDAISGSPEVTHDNVVKRILPKPEPTRLQQALQRLPGSQKARLVLWGDRPKDIHQANALTHQGGMHGVLVNPSAALYAQTVGNTTIPVTHMTTLEGQ